MVRDEYSPGISLREYARRWKDMEPHLDDLAELVAKANTVIEFGVRGAVSTWAMLDAMPEKSALISIDIDPYCPIPPRVRSDERFSFVLGDSRKVDLPAHADVVMIDSSHEYEQTQDELRRAASLTPRVIALHDYLYPETPDVARAVDEFAAEGHYNLEVRPSYWGLAILRPA